MILAHEAYHVAVATKSEISGEMVKELRVIQKKLQEKLEAIVPLYLPETLKDKSATNELITGTVADEIMADIYATIVAGEAYPVLLCEYYLPIMLATSKYKSAPYSSFSAPYSSFVIGSLKIRTAVTALEMMDWGEYEVL